jgi:hypothetical protein
MGVKIDGGDGILNQSRSRQEGKSETDDNQ